MRLVRTYGVPPCGMSEIQSDMYAGASTGYGPRASTAMSDCMLTSATSTFQKEIFLLHNVEALRRLCYK